MARSASALHQQVRINPRPFLWGPTRTRCTQYDLRTATIFTRFEHFPRTVAARRRGAGSAGLCLLCGDVLFFARAPLAFCSFLHPCLVAIRLKKKRGRNKKRREERIPYFPLQTHPLAQHDANHPTGARVPRPASPEPRW